MKWQFKNMCCGMESHFWDMLILAVTSMMTILHLWEKMHWFSWLLRLMNHERSLVDTLVDSLTGKER